MASTDKDGMARYFLVNGEAGHAFMVHYDLHLRGNIRRIFPVVKENSDGGRAYQQREGR
jgi:hypothetical protein